MRSTKVSVFVRVPGSSVVALVVKFTPGLELAPSLLAPGVSVVALVTNAIVGANTTPPVRLPTVSAVAAVLKATPGATTSPRGSQRNSQATVKQST